MSVTFYVLISAVITGSVLLGLAFGAGLWVSVVWVVLLAALSLLVTWRAAGGRGRDDGMRREILIDLESLQEMHEETVRATVHDATRRG